MSTCVLDIDNRETKVSCHTEELSKITYNLKQLTTGDYILRHENNILCVIERKTLDDYAASFKDGRAANKMKLFALREKTGCRVMFIIEGPKDPSPNAKFGKIPYLNIKRSIRHLMIEHGVIIVYTRNTLETAKELVELVQSSDTLLARIGDSSFLCNPQIEHPKEEFNLQELTAPHVKSTTDIVREMWSCFSGITMDNADSFIAKWSIADFVNERVTRQILREHKLSNRQNIRSNTVNSLLTIGPQMAKRLLTKVPQVSATTANILLDDRTLKTMLNAPVEIIAIYLTSAKGTKLGMKRAERLLELFNFKQGQCTDPISEVPEPAALPIEQPEELSEVIPLSPSRRAKPALAIRIKNANKKALSDSEATKEEAFKPDDVFTEYGE